MKIAFFSNFLNHHQLPFSQAMVRLTDHHYTFVATTPVAEEQLQLGYHNMNDMYDFVLKTYENNTNKESAFKLANECDIVIIGSAPSEYVDHRIREGKLTFHYSERLYKSGYFTPQLVKKCIPILWPEFLMNENSWLWKVHGQYRQNTNLYMLCASAFTAGDLRLSGLYEKKTFKWGYFPEVKKQDIDSLLKRKRTDRIQILWVGRFLSWKHPDDCIKMAADLKNLGYDFHFNFIGSGMMEETLRTMVSDCHLENEVSFLGTMSPEKVREYMEKSHIFLFTSDYNEGWGAVLNESMNSGCAVVVSDAVGSAPFLIQNGKNGLLYKHGRIKDLSGKVRFLIDHPNEREKYSLNAYQTLISEWNADEAAARLIELSKNLIEDKTTPFLNGPCSIAKPIIRGRFIRQKNIKY